MSKRSRTLPKLVQALLALTIVLTQAPTLAEGGAELMIIANQEVEIRWGQQWQRPPAEERIPQGYRLFKVGERRHPVGRVADIIAAREKPMHTYTPFRIGDKLYVGYDELHHATIKNGRHVSGEFRGVSVFVKEAARRPGHAQAPGSTFVLRSPEDRELDVAALDPRLGRLVELDQARP